MKKLTNYKKFFLGMTMAVMVILGAFTLKAEQASADCLVTSTLRVGSSGTEVICLQSKIGAQTDGKFGPMTKARVIAFQSSHGLVADGIVGPITRAALNQQVIINPNLPAGCTSTIGYSPLTGVRCDSTTPTTGLPAGCLPGYAYSVTTGQACIPDNQTPGNGDLRGGAGSINVSQTSIDVENEVAEGRSEKVLSFRVEAEDSDIQINNLKVSVENTDTSSNRRPDRYLDNIEVWMGNTKVGSIKASDLTRESGNVYSRNISLNKAIIREGIANRQTFYIVFDSLSNIDTSDMQSANFDLDINNIRYVDASGASLTSTTNISTSGINFIDPASLGDVRMRVSLGTNNPNEGSVQVNEFTSTNNVQLLEFKLKAESDDMTVEEISANLESTGSNLNNILSDVKLMRGNTTLADYSGSFDSDMSQRINFELYDGLNINEGDTETLKIVARLLKQENNFTSGSTIRASLATPLSTYIVAENQSGDRIVNFTGSAAGYIQTLFVNGATISFVSSTSTQVDQAGKVRDFVLVFDVTAIGDDIEVNRTILNNNNNEGIQYIVEGTGTNTSSATLSSNASLSGNTYTVFEGQTRRFTLTVTVTTDTTGQKRIILQEVGGIPTTTAIESVSATVIQ